MDLTLDPESPVPLFHQIVEGLRYRIGRGRLTPGATLPTVRDAAMRWNVNMHTVRRAYAVLSQEGVIESRPGRGTRVLASATGVPRERFLESILREARARYDLSPSELIDALVRSTGRAPAAVPSVQVVECNEGQCADHARELEAAWCVEAHPWSLARDGEPPRGPIVASWFHVNEIRVRWPARRADVYFAAIQPVIPGRFAAAPRGRRTLRVCEREDTMARNIVADLIAAGLDSRWRLEPHVYEPPERILEAGAARTPVLFSPRVWDRLSDDARADPRAVRLAYAFTPEALRSIGDHFGWRERSLATALDRRR